MTNNLPAPLNRCIWVFFRKNKITTAIKVLKSGRVAVTRAFTMKEDTFSEAEGQKRVISRMNSFLALFRKNTKRNKYVTKRFLSNKKYVPGHVLFEVTDAAALPREERAFFNKNIRPNIKPAVK